MEKSIDRILLVAVLLEVGPGPGLDFGALMAAHLAGHPQYLPVQFQRLLAQKKLQRGLNSVPS